MAFGPLTPSAYLRGIDEHVAAMLADKRGPFLEEQLRIIDSHNRALEAWAHHGRGNPPSPFTAFELASITLELSKRLANVRDEANIQTQIAAE